MPDVVKYFLRLSLIADIALTLFACSDFQEGEATIDFKVEPTDVALEADQSVFTVNVSCSDVWNVRELPDWIALDKVSSVKDWAFTWELLFKCTSSEFDRTGSFVVVDSKNTRLLVTVEQKGSRGPKIRVQSLSVSPQTLQLKKGDSAIITATISPSTATDKTIHWATSDESVATVSESGQVSALAPGSAIIVATTQDGDFTDKCEVTVISSVAAVSLYPTSLSLKVGETQELEAVISPEDASNKEVSWASSNEKVATVSQSGMVKAISPGSANIVVTTQDGGFTAECKVEVKSAQPQAVDLGLPSGLKWASWNVGASAPEEYGDFFAWGETQPKSNYSWSNYKWCNGDYNKLTKYCTQSSYWDSSAPMDSKTTLDPEDDAAHVNWGGSWRMPTDSEQYELINNCTWTWTTQNGVYGLLVTSNTNGNSIFLPAAGFLLDSYLYSAGYYGLYWSSSLDTDVPYVAWYVYFYSDNVSRGRYDRCRGQSVRPVYGAFVAVSSIALNHSSVNLDIGETSQLTATLSPSNATEKTIRWVSSNSSVATVSDSGLVSAKAAGSTTITAYASNGKSATCTITVKSTPDYNGHEYVDLGLPSGIKWATCNVGATKPEEYGYYFAWGETAPKNDYDWPTYKWCNGSSYSLTKYNNNSSYGTVDNKTVLEHDDDAARVNWGGSWRMPTEAELNELWNNCTWTWTSNYNGSGVAGRIVMSNINGASIFLPAAGRKNLASLNADGSYGYYWSSSLSTLNPSYASLVNFYSASVSSRFNDYRHIGRSVRPVTE